MRLLYEEIKHSKGEYCPACVSRDSLKKKGILVKKNGRFGTFLGCSRYPDCAYTTKDVDLHKQANDLLKKGKRKKWTKEQRRAHWNKTHKKKKKKTKEQVRGETALYLEIKRQEEFIKNI